jgi:predicted phage terminase large subunit-like protein
MRTASNAARILPFSAADSLREYVKRTDPALLAAAAELARRRRATQSYASFCANIQIPMVNRPAMRPDETLCPAINLFTVHHRAIINCVERVINKPFGRGLIMTPPGSAKSTYGNNTLAPYVMGREANFRLIDTSYATDLAETQSRRAMQIVDSPEYRELAWPYETPLELVRTAATKWSMNNGSECLAAGLTAGITGNRANGAIVDDPVPGRQEAESEAERRRTRNAFRDDLMSRLLPEAWLLMIMTRWSDLDVAGTEVLPPDWKGESGTIIGRDGLEWEVLCIQAKCERTDDPLGRSLGEYMWPEYYPPKHWQMHEFAAGQEAQRAWASLYQQRPTPMGEGMFNKDMFNYYEPGQLPAKLAMLGAGDYAVSAGKNDFTEQGIAGIDEDSNIWFIDWWHGQVTSDVWIEELMRMQKRHATPVWLNEGGVIDKSTRPAIMKVMNERRQYFDLRTIPSMLDKVAKLQAFQARAAAGKVYFPKGLWWTDHVINQLIQIPAGRYDDAADVCGLIGRAIDKLAIARVERIKERPILVPFTAAWIEHTEKKDTSVRYR